MTESGEEFCWGDKWYGQSTGEVPGQTEGIRAVLTPRLVAGVSGFISIVAGGDTSCGLDTAGQAYCWGSNTGTNLQEWPDVGPYPVDGEYVFASLHAGVQHICGLTIDGDAYCWGVGISGNLGSSSESDSRVPIRVSVDVRFASYYIGRIVVSPKMVGLTAGARMSGVRLGGPPYLADPYFKQYTVIFSVNSLLDDQFGFGIVRGHPLIMLFSRTAVSARLALMDNPE